jgi:hypothetical protein
LAKNITLPSISARHIAEQLLWQDYSADKVVGGEITFSSWFRPILPCGMNQKRDS